MPWGQYKCTTVAYYPVLQPQPSGVARCSAVFISVMHTPARPALHALPPLCPPSRSLAGAYAGITESMRFVRGLSESMQLRQQRRERRLRLRAAFALLCDLQRCVAILVPLGLVGAATQQQLRDLGAAEVGRDHERGATFLFVLCTHMGHRTIVCIHFPVTEIYSCMHMTLTGRHCN